MEDIVRTCETCTHYVKNRDKYECHYPMSIYLTCLNSNNIFYDKENVTKSILPSDTKQ